MLGGVRRTYVDPTGRCWGSGSLGRAPGVCPGDLVLSGCSLPKDQQQTCQAEIKKAEIMHRTSILIWVRYLLRKLRIP